MNSHKKGLLNSGKYITFSIDKNQLETIKFEKIIKNKVSKNENAKVRTLARNRNIRLGK